MILHNHRLLVLKEAREMASKVHPYTTPARVRATANHLVALSDEVLAICIDDAYNTWVRKAECVTDDVGLLETLERLIAQHYATINLRRPDSMQIKNTVTQSVTVSREIGLNGTEFGQAAKEILASLGINVGAAHASLQVL